MSDLIIQSLLNTRLKAFAESRDMRVQFENENFDPPSATQPEDGIYLQGFVLPANTTSDTLEGTDKRYSGLYQINICTPQGIGIGHALEIADALSDLFPNNLQLSASDGFVLHLTTPLRRRTGINGVSTYTLPTDFAYERHKF